MSDGGPLPEDDALPAARGPLPEDDALPVARGPLPEDESLPAARGPLPEDRDELTSGGVRQPLGNDPRRPSNPHETSGSGQRAAGSASPGSGQRAAGSASSGNGPRTTGNETSGSGSALTVIAETWRRNVVNVAFVLYVLLVALIAVGAGSFSGTASSMSPFMVLLALIIGARIIGPEFSSGTLQLILAKPINRSAYLLSRVAGTALSVWTALVIVGAFNLIGRALGKNPLHIDRLAFSIGNLAADTLLVIALLALFGSVTRSYFHVAAYITLWAGLAVSLAIFGMIRMARPEIAEALRFVPRIVVFVQDNLFADAPIDQFSSDFLFLALSNAAIALVAACFFFRRREVPYGAD